MLRTFRPNARKNWPVPPSQWNLFFNQLKADMEDLNTEIHAQVFDLTPLLTAADQIIEYSGDDKKTKYPNL